MGLLKLWTIIEAKRECFAGVELYIYKYMKASLSRV